VNSSPKAQNRDSGANGNGSALHPGRILPTGTVLENRYEVLRVAGRGGMSTVYAARDLRFGQVERLCAVKEMGDNETDPGTRALSLVNFERESALLATIAHPAVPKIYDYFSFGGMIYLVLEFIDGDDLERALAKRKSPFAEALVIEWAIQICDVLEMLHGFEPSPIIFRDLKPSNVMLRSTGKIALIDFGIARTFQGDQRGTMIGTEGYAPPEQYRGLVDARGDIYALGATLHHLVTNSDPRQQTPFTFHERPVQSLNPLISDQFAAIVSRMVAYHPDQRHQHVSELRAALEGLQQRSSRPLAQAITGPSPGVIDRLTSVDQVPDKYSPRRTDRRRPSRKRAVRKKHDSDNLAERVAWSTPTGDEVRGTAAFDGESIFIGSYDRSLYCLAPNDGTVRWRFETGRGVVGRPSSLNGMVVFGSEDSGVYCLDTQSGRAIWQYRTSMPVRSSVAIHDQRAIVGSDDAYIYSFSLESGEVCWRQRTWGPVRSSPVIINGVVAVGSDDGNLYALDEVKGAINWRRQSGGALQSEPSASGSIVVSSSRNGSVIGFNYQTGERMWIYQANAPVISSPRIAGDHVIIGVSDGALVALNLEDGQPVWLQRYANQITSTALLGATMGYVGTVDGSCVAFELNTGELVWRHELGGSIVSSPCYAGRLLVLGSTDGRVHGINLTESEILDLEGQKESG
jgi:eukaryotic-like serine/threonine-protein kinase